MVKVKKVSVKDLVDEIPDVPDAGNRWKRIHGAKSGLGFVEFVFRVFELNEDPQTGRKSDATLKALILAEFSNYDQTISSFESGNQSVAKLRHEYNAGRLQPRNWPAAHPGKVRQLSLRYVTGQPVNSRRPTEKATNGWLKLQLQKFSDTVMETSDGLCNRLGRNPKSWSKGESTE